MTPEECYDANYPRLARLQRDRFAISTYPYLIDAYANIDALPADWITRSAQRGDERLLVAETGWLATDAVGTLNSKCVIPIAKTSTAQLSFVELAADRQRFGIDLVEQHPRDRSAAAGVGAPPRS